MMSFTVLGMQKRQRSIASLCNTTLVSRSHSVILFLELVLASGAAVVSHRWWNIYAVPCSSGETSSFQKDGTAIPENCKGSSCSCFHATSGGTLSLRPFCHSGDRRCAISVKVRHISSCAAGDYLHGPSGKCTSCPAGKYSSAQAGHFCEDCQVKGCARCSSPTVCDECVSPTYTRSSDGSSCLPQNLRDVCEKYLVRKHRLSSSTDMLRSIHVGYGGDPEKILADLAKDNHDRDIGVKLCAKWYIMQLQNSASSGNLVHGECRSQEDEALGPCCV